MAITDDLITGFELHSPKAIREALVGGASPTSPIDGRRPVDCLIEMYTRSTRFPECLRAMLDAGASLEDPFLEAVLLDDYVRLGRVLASAPWSLERQLRLNCAYTSLQGVSPLHVCAEYNSVNCARILLKAGVDVDARAEIDADGIGGQTPVFHAVNSNHNHCRDMMELLVDAGASLDVRLKGVVWGAGFEWETVLFDVTPISYAQCGLYAQFHRRDEDVYSNLAYLYKSRYGSEMPVRNVPNRYLLDARTVPPKT